MRRRGKIQALFAVLLTLVMLIGSIPTDAIAVQAEEEPAEITAFDEPEIELTVEVGTQETDIPFPEKLMAQLADGASKEIPVTWEDAGQYNKDAAGTYPFVVKLEGDYTFAGTLPVAKVTVAEVESEGGVTEESESLPETPELEETESDSSETESEPEAKPTEYQNKISGFVWADKVLDGNYDPDAEDENNREWIIADYTIYLLKAEDQSVVAETVTDAEGNYEFTNIEPGKYVVKPHYNTPDTGEYRRSRLGIVGQNKIEAATGTTAVLDILEDSLIEDQNIGMKVKPGFQVKANATYTIDITNSTTTANSISTQSIAAVTFSSNILRFTSAVDPTDTYILTCSAPTGIRVEVNTGVTTKIVLNGVNGSYQASPIYLSSGANVNLTVVGTNTLLAAMQFYAGIRVDPTAILTIDGTDSDTLTVTGGSGAAGIGGNYGESSGTINIKGGVVNATSGNQAAGIGGGRNCSGGTINISGGIVTAKGQKGSAGIGGSYYGGSSGNITISGGVVRAYGAGGGTEHGGPGIGSGSFGTVNNITISGTADVTAVGAYGGAGIGGASNVGGGNIRILGGKVKAEGSPDPANTYGGAGIGGGGETWVNPGGRPADLLEISAAAEVYAYAPRSVTPALWATTVTGTGYYVNAYFGDGPLSLVNSYDLRVHSGNYVGSYLDTVPLPARYASFAYTTGGSAKIYSTRAINNSSGMDEGQVVDYDTNNPNILLSKKGGAAIPSTLYKVKLYPLPFLGDLSHDNVTQTTADVTSTDHTFSLGTQNYGYFDYDLNGSFATNNYTRVPWSSTTANPYTENLTGLTPNTLYYYRVYLKNEYGDTTSTSKKFLTLPQISSWSAAGTSVTDSIVEGSITASDNSNPITGVKVTIATDSGFTSGVQTKTLTFGASTNGYTDTSFTANFGVLASGTYYAKVEVSNISGALGGVTSETTSFGVAMAHTITETYVGLSSGTQIDSSGLPDTTAYATSSYTPASGIPPATHTVSGNTYTYLGYKLDNYTYGDTISSGTPSAVAVSGNRTVYYIYEVLVDVAISKTVTGAYGDPNKAFAITVTLKDSTNAPVAGTYSYTGSAIGGVTPPANGSITLNGVGEGTISLKHGQTITIKNVPKGYTITVRETDAAITSGLYDVSYSGTGMVSGSGNSAVIAQTLGTTAAIVSITNNRSTVPTSGIKGSNYQMASVGILGALAVAALMFFGYRRRKKCR